MFEYYKGISIDGIENITEPVTEENFSEYVQYEEREKIGLGNGVKVSHERFGLGEVIEEVGTGEFKKLRILFESSGEKLLLAKFANLTHL